MAALLTDVFSLEEHALVEVGIEVGLHFGVADVGGPAHKVVHGFLRAVGVVDLQTVALTDDVIAHGLQRLGGFLGQQGDGLFVAVDAGADEIVGAVVAYLQNGVGDGF